MKAPLIIILILFVAIIIWYAAIGREWLKSKAWASGFFAAIEPIEIMLYKKSETILFARLKVVTGVLLSVLTMLGGIDLSIITPFVPEQHQGLVNLGITFLPLIISLVGMMDERLRNETTKPLELVSLPEASLSPEVEAAVAAADVTKNIAVAVVKGEERAIEAIAEAKAEAGDDSHA